MASACDPPQIASGDPLLKRLVHIHAAPLFVGAVCSIGFMAVHGLVAWAGGTFRTQGYPVAIRIRDDVVYLPSGYYGVQMFRLSDAMPL